MGNDPAIRRPRPRWLAALALAAVGVVAVVVSVAASGAGTPAPGAAILTAASPSPTSGLAAPGWAGPRGGRGWMGSGGRMGHGPFGTITITGISGTKLSLQTTDGWTRTIDAAGATITRAGQTIKVGDLKVGDQVAFSETRQSDGTFKVTAINVVLPEVGGTISAVGASSVTITQHDGSSRTVELTSSTTFTLGTQSATKDALTVGSRVEVEGTQASDGTFTALKVQILPTTAAGTVTAKGAASITLKLAGGSSVTVKVSSSTTYEVAGKTSAGFADVAVGDRIAVQGTRNADGSIQASLVRAAGAGTYSYGPMGEGFGPMGEGFGPMGEGFGPMGGRGMGPFGGFGGPAATPSPSTGTSGA